MEELTTASVTSQDFSRRDALRRGAFVVGAATLWTTPVVQTLGMRSAYALTSPVPNVPPSDFFSYIAFRLKVPEALAGAAVSPEPLSSASSNPDTQPLEKTVESKSLTRDSGGSSTDEVSEGESTEVDDGISEPAGEPAKVDDGTSAGETVEGETTKIEPLTDSVELDDDADEFSEVLGLRAAPATTEERYLGTLGVKLEFVEESHNFVKWEEDGNAPGCDFDDSSGLRGVFGDVKDAAGQQFIFVSIPNPDTVIFTVNKLHADYGNHRFTEGRVKKGKSCDPVFSISDDGLTATAKANEPIFEITS